MILLLTGPSGVGKTTVVTRLLAAEPRLSFSISTTTRPPRPGERDGHDYDFVDDATFDDLVAEGAFVEWAAVHDHRYGTRRSRLTELTDRGRIPLLDIDVQGGRQVIDIYGDGLVSVFLFPPSWAELKRRLNARGTDPAAVIARRLANARREIAGADRYRYWLVNEDVAETVIRLQAIMEAEACRREAYAQPPLSPDDPEAT